jgi:hypothetical protein
MTSHTASGIGDLTVGSCSGDLNEAMCHSLTVPLSLQEEPQPGRALCGAESRLGQHTPVSGGTSVEFESTGFWARALLLWCPLAASEADLHMAHGH